MIPDEARDLDTAYDLIMAADDDTELWESIAVALSEARNEGRCQPRAEENVNNNPALREAVARALHDDAETDFDDRRQWDDADELARTYCRRLADAAIAAIEGADA